MKKNEIYINSFVRRQTSDSSFTHFEGSDDMLLTRLDRSTKTKPGYREGVTLVILEGEDAEGFYTGLVTLQDGEELTGKFEARREGETPRKSIRAKAVLRNVGKAIVTKQPCKMVEVVLYGHEVLAEDGDAESELPWEIISLNGYPTEEAAPIAPDTLCHNHFESDGGTATGMSAEEFEAAMEESFAYWKDKALLE